MMKIFKNAVFWIITIVSFASLCVGSAALVDWANKTHTEAIIQEQDKQPSSDTPQEPIIQEPDKQPQEPVTHTVSFRAIFGNQTSGLHGEMEDIETSGEAPFVMPKNAFVAKYVGMTVKFYGWSCTNHLSDEVYFENEVLPADFFDDKQDVTFYTLWALQSSGFDTKYFSDGSSISNVLWIVEGDDGEFRIFDLPTKEGYIFDGYYSEKNGAGVLCIDVDGWFLCSLGEYDAYYSNWIPISTPYNITFDANGGDGSMDDVTLFAGDVFPEATFARDGFRFAGWRTSLEGETLYCPGVTVSDAMFAETNVTLYAIWERFVVLDCAGGSLNGSTSIELTFLEDDPYFTPTESICIDVPSRAGYTFQGFYTQPNGLGVQRIDSSGEITNVFSLPWGTTLYAYWTMNSGIEY